MNKGYMIDKKLELFNLFQENYSKYSNKIIICKKNNNHFQEYHHKNFEQEDFFNAFNELNFGDFLIASSVINNQKKIIISSRDEESVYKLQNNKFVLECFYSFKNNSNEIKYKDNVPALKINFIQKLKSYIG